jgi:MYXO-CTERM domain-containing protein
VPLAALGLAVVAYSRLQGGGRAAVALVVGFFGIVFGVEAANYTAQVGPSGDDFTGVLSMLAGIALLGLGFITLWRTRRRQASPLRRSLRRATIGVAGLVVGFFICTRSATPTWAPTWRGRPVDDIELGSTNVEDVELHTSDGLTLKGSYVPPRNGAA